MPNFIKRPTNQYKVRNAEYRPWNLRNVIETYAGRPYEEVLREQKEKRELLKR